MGARLEQLMNVNTLSELRYHTIAYPLYKLYVYLLVSSISFVECVMALVGWFLLFMDEVINFCGDCAVIC